MNYLKNFMTIKNKKLITHNGSFHADDIFATATLSILLEKNRKIFEIIRTRDPKIVETGDYVYDIGGVYNEDKNRFDHHQKGGAGKRENGIEYSSFGLVWKKFGDEITGSSEIAKRVDERLVQIIDAKDNGINISNSIISNVINYEINDIISAFHPSYKEVNPDFDVEFLEILIFAKKLLLKEIEKAQDQESIHKYILNILDKKNSESKILILDEYIPRVEIEIELINYPNILFVVVPGIKEALMWKILALRKDMNYFECRKNLPATWAGLKDKELQKITGVADAEFCHRALFMAVAKSKEGAIKLVQIAVES